MKDYIGNESQWKIEKNIAVIDIKKIIYNEELAKYIKKRMKGCRVKGVHGEWLYVEEPFEDELDFWIQQYKIKEGHTEWSESLQRNIWIEDEE